MLGLTMPIPHIRLDTPLVQQFLDVGPLGALWLCDGAALLQGPRGVAKATAQNLEVSIALVAQRGVGCSGRGE